MMLRTSVARRRCDYVSGCANLRGRKYQHECYDTGYECCNACNNNDGLRKAIARAARVALGSSLSQKVAWRHGGDDAERSALTVGGSEDSGERPVRRANLAAI